VESVFKELFGFGAERRVILRKFRESIKRPGADDGAAVGFKVAAKGSGSALAFARGELEARKHLREVPTQFDLRGFGEEPEELGFVAGEQAGIFAGDFFGGVGGAHADDGIVMPEAGDEFAEELWLLKDEFGDLVGATDGAAVGAF